MDLLDRMTPFSLPTDVAVYGIRQQSRGLHTQGCNEISIVHKTIHSFYQPIITTNSGFTLMTTTAPEGQKTIDTFARLEMLLRVVGLSNRCFFCVLAPPADMGVKMLQCFPFYRRCKERCKRQCPPETGKIQPFQIKPKGIWSNDKLVDMNIQAVKLCL